MEAYHAWNLLAGKVPVTKISIWKKPRHYQNLHLWSKIQTGILPGTRLNPGLSRSIPWIFNSGIEDKIRTPGLQSRNWELAGIPVSSRGRPCTYFSKTTSWVTSSFTYVQEQRTCFHKVKDNIWLFPIHKSATIGCFVRYVDPKNLVNLFHLPFIQGNSSLRIIS